MISMSPLSIRQAEASLEEVWRCSTGGIPLAGTTAAEHMRALLYGVYGAQQDSPCTLHTARLLASARRVIELLWPQYIRQPAQDDLCATMLRRMHLIGDAVDAGNGQWLAAPLRIVSSGGSDCHLLLGAAPADAVRRRLGVLPICAAASRFIEKTVFEAPGSDDLVISPDTWLGGLPALPVWTSQALAILETRMEAVGGLTADQLEIYAPDVARAQRHQGRWVPAGQISRVIDGMRLCRPQDRYAKSWNRPYYLAHFDFKRGALMLRRAAFVDPHVRLRLCFGLDAVLQTPRQLSIKVHHGGFSIERPLTLPEPESRVFALGWNDDTPLDSEQVTFHAHAMPFVLHAFKRLSIVPSLTRDKVS